MNKILTAALLVAALSAKAQTSMSEAKQIVFSKCFCEPKPLKYTRLAHTETLIINDSTYTLDWATRDVVIEGKVYRMEEVTRYKDAVEVVYNSSSVITLLYKNDRCIDYILEEE